MSRGKGRPMRKKDVLALAENIMGVPHGTIAKRIESVESSEEAWRTWLAPDAAREAAAREPDDYLFIDGGDEYIARTLGEKDKP